MDTVYFSTRTALEAVLTSTDFEPPPAHTTGVGPLADLRAEMARFSSSEHHAERRSAVDASVARISAFDFRAEAERRTRALLTGVRPDAIAELGFVVPTEVLGSTADKQLTLRSAS